ncbi:cytochrome P450 [Artomyces pyxidatus]|uniref:Cytochrome P450 n=1 Tax=Artomyces pyxidatus TaxID=48021 RepID=A0ACB8SGW1_9AGAM|nr:cytochrome P450 [Artomyces pyxidatus]
MSVWEYLALLATAATALFWIWRRSAHNLPLPPGPTGHWLWGAEIPARRSFLKYAEWTKQYGPVCSFRSGLRTVVVIGSFQAASDIMEKEGVATADRPRAIAGSDIMSGGMRILLIGVGERFRKLRKALHVHLQPKAAATYEPMQLSNARQLVRDILEDPDNHYQHAKRYSASLILSLTYGQPSPSKKSDPNVQLIREYLIRLAQALRPGAHLVDDLPWVKYLPWYGRALRKAHLEELDLFQRQLQGARNDIAKGDPPPSFAKYLLEKQGMLGLSDSEIAYLAGSMFGAGSETTAAAISFVIMAAACHPEAQARVQEELDNVVGPDRLPSFADWDALPQVRAFFSETYRWRPGTSGGIQHRTTKDIIYNGYRIPAGATLIANHWSIGRDPEVFPDGDTFNPQRWIDDEGRVKESLKFPNFGYGRRICPGMPVANRSVFINTAILLQSFSISQDPAHPIDTLSVRGEVVTLPDPFKAHFSVRHRRGVEGLQALLAAEA